MKSLHFSGDDDDDTTLEITPSRDFYETGTNISLECKYKNNRFQLYSFLRRTRNSTGQKIVSEENESTFKITSAKLSDTGIYWCQYGKKGFFEPIVASKTKEIIVYGKFRLS